MFVCEKTLEPGVGGVVKVGLGSGWCSRTRSYRSSLVGLLVGEISFGGVDD